MHLSFEEALARLPGPSGERFVSLWKRGSLTVELYAPRDHDPQSPHRHDEVYVVFRGEGTFRRGTTRYPFRSGDVLFAAAYEDHAFEDFTSDLAVWVIFYGPEGGELPSFAGGNVVSPSGIQPTSTPGS
ncbi:MAG: cupin domain-containing protein [Gemmatimonadales bacterium]